jgi:hypothetical protein
VRTEPGDGARDDAASGEPRDEMQAAPPFLTWGAIYAIVIGALAVEVAICAALTR